MVTVSGFSSSLLPALVAAVLVLGPPAPSRGTKQTKHKLQQSAKEGIPTAPFPALAQTYQKPGSYQAGPPLQDSALLG